jgi:NDP-sugar pyrophosphorylase family protein
VDMPDVLNQALAKGLRIGTFPIHEDWIDVGRIGDLTRAQRKLSDEWPEF